MELSIGTNIKRLRQARKLTQDELANHLGVSFQAISKWERGDGYPDIIMLPALANYFGVSVDELIGTTAETRRARFNAIWREWQRNHGEGRHKENITLMRDALTEYPNDPLLLVQLSTSLERADGTPEKKAANLRESIAVQEQIIDYCDDCEIRGATLFNICFSYQKNGEPEKALAQAKKLPNLYKGRENALLYFTEGEEKRKIALSALQPLGWSVVHHFTALAELEREPAYLERARAILDLLFVGVERNEFIEGMYERCKGE